jgi:hypothetical protein
MNTPSELAIGLISGLDIDSFDSVPTGTLVLVNPATLAPTTSTVTLASAENPLRKKIELAKQRKYRNDVQKTGKIQFSDPAEEIEEETDYLVTSTLGWTLTQAGAPLPFTADAARALYTDPKKHWLRAQVIAALSKTELFIKDSAKP